MKKLMKSAVAASMAAALLTSAAGAASFTSSADALRDLGLFQGSDKGYELDRAADRAEAATMLVRLLGKEAEAKESWEASDSEFPFTDLENGYQWAKPYVAWLYDQGLTAGATETTFEPNKPVTAQQYCTFLMRALGYSDKNGDFTYDKAVEFATEKGVADLFNLGDPFLRDNVAAMSYAALAAAPKAAGYDTITVTCVTDDKAHYYPDASTFMTKLVADKAVDAAAAKPVESKFATLRELNQISAEMNTQTAVDASAKMDMDMTAEGETVKALFDFDMQAEVDPENIAQMQFAMDGTMTMTIPGVEEGELSLPVAVYLKDDVCYMNMMGQKIKQDMNMAEMFKDIDFTTMMNTSSIPVGMVESVSKTGDTYALSYNTGSFDSLFKNIFSMAYDSIEITDEMKEQGVTEEMLQMSIDLSKADFTMTVKNGKVTAETVDMAMQMVMAGEPIDAAVRMELTINKTGDAVTVQFPADLDSYMTAEEAAAAMEEAMSGVDKEVTAEE